MKKTSKKFAALFVALMVALTVMVPAFATSTPTTGATETAPTADSTATINVETGNEGDFLYMYKVVTANFDVASNNLTMEFTALFEAFLAATGSTMTIEDYDALDDDSDALEQLLGDFTAYVKTNSSAYDYESTTVTGGAAAFENVAMGQYIIVGGGNTNGALIYQTVTAEVIPHIVNREYRIYSSYEVEMKTDDTSVDKEITGGTEADGSYDTATIGDEITFELKIAVPTYPLGATNKTFFVGDTLSSGLKLNADSINVKGFTSDFDAGTELAAPAYTTDTSGATDNGGTFFVDLNIDEIKSYKFITIEYTVTLTEEAVLGTAVGNPNDVVLVFSNDPFNGDTWEPSDDPEDPDRPTEDDPGYGSHKDKEIVYTYALLINKFAAENKELSLANATFEVRLGSADGTLVGTITTNANGVAELKGLETGEYYLIETVAPTGYNLALEPVKITIDSNSIPFTTETVTTVTEYTSVESEALYAGVQATRNGNLLWVNVAGDLVEAEEAPEGFLAAYVKSESEEISISETEEEGAGYFKQDIENSKGITVPGTGGIGTTIFYIVGGLLMAAALVVLVTKKRMRATSN